MILIPYRTLLSSLLLALATAGWAQTNVVSGSATVHTPNISHANGRMYDQVLLTGNSATLRADTDQVLRCSFLDLDGDIIQVEYAGPGQIKIDLDPTNALPAAPPAKYNQPSVSYVAGRATVTIDNNTADSYVTIFSVGTVNASNQALFPAGQTYDGLADVALLRINGSAMGSILTGNVRYNAASGMTGIYAPGTAVKYRAILHAISAASSATPVLQFGAGSTFSQDAGSVLIAGSDLTQPNSAAIDVSSGAGNAIVSLVTVANVRSSNVSLPRLTLPTSLTFRGASTDQLMLDGASKTFVNASSGGGSGTGVQLTFFAGSNPPYTNGAKKTFQASLTELRFDSTILTNPTVMSLNAPLTGARFTDAATGLTWEVYYRNNALHEINVMRGTSFAGQWSP